MKSPSMPTALRNTCIAALHGNTTTITGCKKQKPIEFKRGVAQGGPLSQVLFYLAIDDLIAELDEIDIKAAYGYEAGSESTSVLSFADDTAVIGKDHDAAQRLIDIAAAGFARYGLRLNATKTHWLAIIEDRLYYTAQPEHNTEAIETENVDEKTTEEVYVRNHDVLELAPIMLNDQPIMPIQQHTVARYLGANFAPIQTFYQNIYSQVYMA